MSASRLAFAAALVLAGSAARAQKTQFSIERLAQRHCPRDTVVWVNTNSGIYHFKGERWYGRTNAGAYECRRDADAEGDRATRNGQ